MCIGEISKLENKCTVAYFDDYKSRHVQVYAYSISNVRLHTHVVHVVMNA